MSADATLRAAERAYAADPFAEGAWEALQCARARAGQPRACDTCGERHATATLRENGSTECVRCWRDALHYGHREGMHDDHPCPDCVECAYDGAMARS